MQARTSAAGLGAPILWPVGLIAAAVRCGSGDAGASHGLAVRQDDPAGACSAGRRSAGGDEERLARAPLTRCGCHDVDGAAPTARMRPGQASSWARGFGSRPAARLALGVPPAWQGRRAACLRARAWAGLIGSGAGDIVRRELGCASWAEWLPRRQPPAFAGSVGRVDFGVRALLPCLIGRLGSYRTSGDWGKRRDGPISESRR